MHQKLHRLTIPDGTTVVLKILDKTEGTHSHEALFFKIIEMTTETLDGVHFNFWSQGCLEFYGHYPTPEEQFKAMQRMKVSINHMLYHFY